MRLSRGTMDIGFNVAGPGGYKYQYSVPTSTGSCEFHTFSKSRQRAECVPRDLGELLLVQCPVSRARRELGPGGGTPCSAERWKRPCLKCLHEYARSGGQGYQRCKKALAHSSGLGGSTADTCNVILHLTWL